jgi:hypothetical protein
MFGGEFGAFGSRQRHCSDETAPAYGALAKVIALRKQRLALRRGRQYLRPISGNGIDFGLRPAGSTLCCIHSSDPLQVGSQIAVEPRNGSAAQLTVPAAGFAICE